MEYWQSEHPLRYGGTWVWHYYRRCKHSLPLLWDVEDNICVAYWGHGSVQHQLLAFWGAKILVSDRVLSRWWLCTFTLYLETTAISLFSSLPISINLISLSFPIFFLLSYSTIERNFTSFHANLLRGLIPIFLERSRIRETCWLHN